MSKDLLCRVGHSNGCVKFEFNDIILLTDSGQD
jgi:hypothetical protein